MNLYLNKEGSTRVKVSKLLCRIELVLDTDMVLWDGSDCLRWPFILGHDCDVELPLHTDSMSRRSLPLNTFSEMRNLFHFF